MLDELISLPLPTTTPHPNKMVAAPDEIAVLGIANQWTVCWYDSC
jgi:hypothetical protein